MRRKGRNLMKRGSLTVLGVSILLMISGLVSSLEALESPTIGLKLGYTRSQLRAEETGEDVQVKKMATNGVTIGLVGNIRLTNWLYFQPEFLYFQKGGKYDVQVPLPVFIPGFQVNVVDNKLLEYLEIPLLLKVALPLGPTVKPTFLTGLSAGLKLRGQLENRVNISIAGLNISHFRTENVTSQLNTIEIRFVFGGGLDFEIGPGRLAVDQRFSFGLNKNKYETIVPASYFQEIGIPVPADIVYRLNMNNYVFCVGLTYFF